MRAGGVRAPGGDRSVLVRRQAGQDVPEAVHALRLDAPFLQGLEQRAAGLAVVLAVAKAAVAEQFAELDEAGFHVVAADVYQAEFADAGRVDQLAAVGKMVCVPLPVSSESAPTRMSTPGSRLLTSEDLPTPDWPTNTLT